MTTSGKDSGRWYVKREEEILGPFPNQLISRYLILGRFELDTLVSPDKNHWSEIKNFRALVPDVVLNANTREGARALMLARIREDERSNDNSIEPDPSDDRRSEEDQIVKLHRQLKDDILKRYKSQHHLRLRYTLILLGVAVVLVGIILSLSPSENIEGADCSLPAKAGVNWSSCNKQGESLVAQNLSAANFSSVNFSGADFSRSRLDGSDLSYADLSGANLQSTSLAGANLTGTVLRGANLRDADLSHANLAYAELSGARLEGANLGEARFDHAIWINGETCLAGSMGGCLQSEK